MDTLTLDLPSTEESIAAKYYGKMVGAGAYREVFRIPGSNWVYKFETELSWSSTNGANLQEYRNYKNKSDNLPAEVAFPEVHLLENNVIAMQFIEGIHGIDAHKWVRENYVYRSKCFCIKHGLSRCWEKSIYGMNLIDLHGRNVILSRKNGKIYIIDIGETGTR